MRICRTRPKKGLGWPSPDMDATACLPSSCCLSYSFPPPPSLSASSKAEHAPVLYASLFLFLFCLLVRAALYALPPWPNSFEDGCNRSWR